MKTASGNSKNHARNRVRKAVPARYTFQKLKDDVQYLNATKSLRAIARILNERAGSGKRTITHRTVQRILSGQEPREPNLRDALGLPCYAPAPICSKCGTVHVTKKCTAGNKQRVMRYRYVTYPTFASSELVDLAQVQPDARVIVLGQGFDYENVKVGYARSRTQ